MRWAKTATKAQKTATKGPFGLLRRGLLRQFYPPLLWCRYRSIVAVTKSATIDRPFSNAFGLLRQAENRHHMRLPFGSSDLLAAGIKHRYRVLLNNRLYAPFSGSYTHRYMCEALVAVFARRYRFFSFFSFFFSPRF